MRKRGRRKLREGLQSEEKDVAHQRPTRDLGQVRWLASAQYGFGRSHGLATSILFQYLLQLGANIFVVDKHQSISNEQKKKAKVAIGVATFRQSEHE